MYTRTQPSEDGQASLADQPGEAWYEKVEIDRRRPAGPQLYEVLRLAIIQEDLKPSDPINETDLSQWFGVSRTPIREAYQHLMNDGLIVVRSKVGTIVAPINEDRVREGIIIRRALEREVVTLICEKQVDLRILDESLALQSICVAHDDPVGFFSLDEDFHAKLANLAGLPAAWRLAHSVKAHTDRTRIALTKSLPNRINIAFGEHGEIVAALKAHDAELARALMSKHVNSALESVAANVT